MKKLKVFLFILVFYLALDTAYYLGDNSKDNCPKCVDNPKICETCMMYKAEVKFGVTGLYFKGKDYYCVWTKDRNMSDIENTDRHESCHDFVYKNYEHFC